MSQPLSKLQQDLRGRKVIDMTDAQLKDWVDACHKMETWPQIEAKGRRSWKTSRLAAEVEIESRAAKRQQQTNSSGK